MVNIGRGLTIFSLLSSAETAVLKKRSTAPLQIGSDATCTIEIVNDCWRIGSYRQIIQTTRNHKETSTVKGDVLDLGKTPSSVSRNGGWGELWNKDQDNYLRGAWVA